MAHARAPADDTNPWGEHVDARHITGDYYFVNRYRSSYWILASVLTLLVPPVGAFLLTYYASECLTVEGQPIEPNE